MPWIFLLHHYSLFFLSLSENPNSGSFFAPFSLSAFGFHNRIRNQSGGMEEFDVGYESYFFFSWRVLNDQKWYQLG
ncbi:hypothetical protein E2542_SST15434 [Spatholobus suberectus]|nr:hypothetical protein E2542_SST15434 [Spatholobus suberectus]